MTTAKTLGLSLPVALSLFDDLLGRRVTPLNVTSRLMNRAWGVRYKLREQALADAPLPDDAADIVTEA